MGKIQAGLIYPPSLVLRHLPIVQMFNWDAVLHIFFAGSGIFLLLRHWQLRQMAAFIGAIIFMFSGAIIPRVMIGHVSVLHTIAWLGWILFAYDRLLRHYRWRDLLLSVWFTILIILGGHPQMSVLVLLVPVTFFFFVRLPQYIKKQSWKEISLSIFYSMLVVVLSICLLSVQLIPFLNWLEQTGRGQGNAISSLVHMTHYSLNLEYIINTILPLLWFAPVTLKTIFFDGFSHFWEASPFITVTGLFLILFGTNSILLNKQENNSRPIIIYLIGLVIAALLMSIGNHNPLYKLLHTYYPYFRAPGRFLIWWAFAIALLVGFIINSMPMAWETNEKQLRRGKFAALFLIIICCILWVVFQFRGASMLVNLETYDWFSEGFTTIALESIPRSLKLLGATSAGLFIIFWLGETRRLTLKQWELGLVILILFESFAFSRILINPFPVIHLFNQEHPLAQLTIDPGEIRIDGYRFPPNYLTPTLTHVLNGEEYFALERLMKEGGERAKFILAGGFLATKEPIDDPDYTLLQKGDSSYLYEHIENFPRLYATTSVQLVRSDDEAFDFIMAEDFNLSQRASITLTDGENPPNLPLESDEAAVYSAKYTSYQNDSITAEVTTDRPILVVFNEMYYFGWEATVNKKPVPIFRTNYSFRGIPLESSGTYLIEMAYRPDDFYFGLFVSGVTLTIILFVTIFLVVRKYLKKKQLIYA